MDTFTQGTKEFYIVDLTDQLGLVNDLSTSTPKYDIRGPSSAYVSTDNNAIVNSSNLMELWCLIDTTIGGAVHSPDGLVLTWLAGGQYRLYVTLTTLGSEAPRFGPYSFTVDDT